MTITLNTKVDVGDFLYTIINGKIVERKVCKIKVSEFEFSHPNVKVTYCLVDTAGTYRTIDSNEIGVSHFKSKQELLKNIVEQV